MNYRIKLSERPDNHGGVNIELFAEINDQIYRSIIARGKSLEIDVSRLMSEIAEMLKKNRFRSKPSNGSPKSGRSQTLPPTKTSPGTVKSTKTPTVQPATPSTPWSGKSASPPETLSSPASKASATQSNRTYSRKPTTPSTKRNLDQWPWKSSPPPKLCPCPTCAVLQDNPAGHPEDPNR